MTLNQMLKLNWWDTFAWVQVGSRLGTMLVGKLGHLPTLENVFIGRVFKFQIA